MLMLGFTASHSAADESAPPCETGASVAAPPHKQAFFNEPITTAGTATSPDAPGAPSGITAGIVSLILQAAEKSTIKIAMYHIGEPGTLPTDTLDSDLIIEALRRVHYQCDVTVQVITDAANVPTKGTNELATFATISTCYHGCFSGDNADYLMHNKFMLINDMAWTNTAENLVVQMTANWTQGSLSDQWWNAMVAIWADSPLFASYNGYWDELYSCRRTGSRPAGCSGGTDPTQGGSGNTGASVNYFPQTSGDPVITGIENVDCSTTDPSTIQVMMSFWSGLRGTSLADTDNSIAKALRARKVAGCVVQIVLPTDQETAVNALIAAGLEHHCSADRRTSDLAGLRTNEVLEEPTEPDLSGFDGRLGPAVHSKYMIINGTYSDDPNSAVVFVGSQNFTRGSLEDNDETWLKIWARGQQFPENRPVVEAFEANFAHIWASTPVCLLPPQV